MVISTSSAPQRATLSTEVQPKSDARAGAARQRSQQVRMALNCLTSQGIGHPVRRPLPQQPVARSV